MPEWGPRDWADLLENIKNKACTPVLGRYVLPKNRAYPLDATWVTAMAQPNELDLPVPSPATIENLSYLESLWSKDRTGLRRRMRQVFKRDTLPLNLDNDEEALAVLAGLPIPFYVTTVYHDWFFQAFKDLQKEPKRRICKWWSDARDRWDPQYDPIPYLTKEDTPFKVATPLIYHLFGVCEHIHTMVLNEDDYFDFYGNTSGALGTVEAVTPIPHVLDNMLGGSNGILLLGYHASDWDFKVVFHLLHRFMTDRSAHVAVQLEIDETLVPQDDLDRYREAYSNYFESKFNVSVYWGTCQEFVIELRNLMATAKPGR
jgi:SIR2-like domain